MRGIVLAGGNGTRLFPLTRTISKQLLPVYDKPMIYYPLQTLKSMGIKEIAIITKPEDHNMFYAQLGNGRQFDLEFTYFMQHKPNGLAEAFTICKNFIKDEDVALILGDNIFLTPSDNLENVKANTIFLYKVTNPNQYGVADFNEDGSIKGIVEKPADYISDQAVVGLYVFDKDVVGIAANVRPSSRGELEIADVINAYINAGKLNGVKLCDASAWFDCGTVPDLLDCANYIRAIRNRTNLKVGL